MKRDLVDLFSSAYESPTFIENLKKTGIQPSINDHSYYFGLSRKFCLLVGSLDVESTASPESFPLQLYSHDWLSPTSSVRKNGLPALRE